MVTGRFRPRVVLLFNVPPFLFNAVMWEPEIVPGRLIWENMETLDSSGARLTGRYSVVQSLPFLSTLSSSKWVLFPERPGTMTAGGFDPENIYNRTLNTWVPCGIQYDLMDALIFISA